MSLRIDIPNRKYTANAPVIGTVTLVGAGDVGVGNISIHFTGRCKSRIVISRGNNGNSYHRGRIPLFAYSQELFKGPHTLHPNEHSWPFSFRFPSRCEVRYADQFSEPNSRFNDDPNQELPASYVLGERGYRTKCSGYVSYQLEATLVRDGTKIFTSQSTSTTKSLRLVRPRTNAEPSPNMFAVGKAFDCRSLHLLPSHAERSLTFMERLSSTWSKNVPNAAFKVILQMPKVGVVGQALPMFLGVDHMPESSTAPASPGVFLKNVSIYLMSNGTVRAIDTDVFSFGNHDKTDMWEEKIEIAFLDLKETATSIPEYHESPMDLRELMNLKLNEITGFLRMNLTPSFSTFNLEVHYWLRVKVTVECAQKKFQNEFLSRCFDLLPEEWTGQSANTAQASSSQSTDVPAYQNHAGEPLPPYAKNPELWTPTGVPPKADGFYGQVQ